MSALVVAVLFTACVFLELLRRREIQTAQALRAELERCAARAEALSRYEAIEDAEAEASRILRESTELAERTLRQSTETAERTLWQSTDAAETRQREAEQVYEQARQHALSVLAQARENGEAALSSARVEATRIMDLARAEALQIAGDAFEAQGKAAHYKEVARAMKNIIDGYGDEYLVPNRSLLDDLADEFDHKAAGVELAAARKRSKKMLKDGLAATCDYKEVRRRETAIHFVVDAFNGKVSSILSRIRHDNLGKLSQQIKDAFALVNKNGEAFKNARIQPEYLDAMMQELRWGVATHELKIAEREEQRSIKEAMREEEKARREYQKAIKDAEKEERMMHKALEEAERRLRESTLEERGVLEGQLAELRVKLAEAEAKNQRAISMAQQTKQGHVYVISNVGSFGEGIVKIGLTRRLEPMERVKELGDASVPFAFDVHAMMHHDDAPALEAELHRRFDEHRLNKVNRRKEFFSVPLKAIREVAAELQIDAHWTLTAEAREYRESKANARTLAEAEAGAAAEMM